MMRILVLLLAWALQAKEPLDWKKGKVARVFSAPPISSVEAIRSLKWVKSFTYTIDGADATYRAAEQATRPALALDSAVEFVVSGRALYIREADGKSLKLDYLGSTPK